MTRSDIPSIRIYVLADTYIRVGKYVYTLVDETARFLFTLFLLLFCSYPAFSQSAFRNTTHSNLFGVGGTRQQDSYLSPLNYNGVQINYLHEMLRQTHLLDSCVTFQTILQADLSTTDNNSEKASFLGGFFHYDATWHYCLHGSATTSQSSSGKQPFSLFLGPQIGATLGALYNTRNGNNPAQATAEIHLSASLSAIYTFRLWRQPFTLRDQIDVPIIGGMFSPAFGQSYYELFTLGNYDHNVCLTTPFNAFTLRNMLTIDIPLRRCTLRLGYLADFRQSNVNDIKHHTYSHSFLLGWVKHLRIQRPRRSTPAGFVL